MRFERKKSFCSSGTICGRNLIIFKICPRGVDHCQTSKKELFVKTVNDRKLLLMQKISILDAEHGSECVSVFLLISVFTPQDF